MRPFAFLGVVTAAAIVLAAPAGSVAGQQPPVAEKQAQAADKKVPEQKPGEKPAQAPETKDAAAAAGEPAREVPPERKALNEATKISDPDKKIEALRKVVEDFPKSSVAESANFAIFTTLVTEMKDTGKKVLEQAKLLAEAGTDNSRGSQYTRLASTLLAQDLLLQDAEAFALKGIEALDEKKFVEARKASFAESAAEALKRDPKAKPMQAPDDAQLAKMFVTSKQNAYSTLGQIYAKLGKHAEAEKALRELQSKKGDEVAILLFNEGAEAVKVGDLDNAERRFVEALTAKPDLHQAIDALMIVYARKNDWANAATQADKVLANDPASLRALRIRHEAYAKLGDTEKAKQALDALAKADPKALIGSFFDAGVAKFNANDSEGAIADFTKVIELDADYATAHYYLGLCYTSASKPDLAKTHLERFVALAPNDANAAAAREMLKYLK
jgi:tetratricopeptide (TPR) repeat protein